jgi:uncharacterized OsmC-like protein
LRISEDVPVRYRSIRVSFRVDADIPKDQKEELVRMARKYSLVLNTITESAPLFVHLQS